MTTTIKTTILALACIAAFAPSLLGERIGLSMTYHELTIRSDVVVIAHAFPPRVTDNTDRLMPEVYEQLETGLLVKSVIKGPQDTPQKLRFVHFRYKPGIGPAINAPTPLEFRTKWKADAKRRKIAVSETYLLFLKRRVDGRFEAITGQEDAANSVFMLSSSDGTKIRAVEVDPNDPFLD